MKTAQSILKLITLAVTVTASPSLVEAADRKPKPNIVLVFIDDMGWGDFSCFGNNAARTPHIDRLAKEGIRFEQFYVNSPICSPSRTAISTGQYPQRWRITSYLAARAKNEQRGMAQWLDPKAPMLARSLQHAGYATGHFGKWHMGGQRDVDNAPPITDYGFDVSLTNFEGMGPKLLPLVLKPGQKKPDRIWGDAQRLGKGYRWMLRSEITGGFVDAAIPFMKQARDTKQPFYVNLWPDDVHSPFWPPVDKWADGKRGLYHSVLQEMDSQLGKLFDLIRSDATLRDNTLVLVCSDNGPERGAGSAGPFRGFKTHLYEGGVRSSLVVWGPGLIDQQAAGTTNEDSILCAMDINASLYTIAHVAAPAETVLDGEPLSATLLGKSRQGRSSPIFWSASKTRGSSLLFISSTRVRCASSFKAA
ncbi:MAG: sulfatase-like hydrolase/transferase [Planctomycetaceae bacterium]